MTDASAVELERSASRLRLQISIPKSSTTMDATPAPRNASTTAPTATTVPTNNNSTASYPKVSPTPPPRSKASASATTSPHPKTWPLESSQHLPPLDPILVQSFQHSSESPLLNLSINDECTALKFTPTGRLLVGGFTDGTVRLFDLTGRYSHKKKKHTTAVVPATACSFATDPQSRPTTTTTTTQSMVCSKDFQLYGAVACQIHAKGVHTALLMDCDISPDGLWCFAGVLRGSMELMALHLGHLEASYDTDNSSNSNLLDHVSVHRHTDAKLRGFGACTRLKDSNKYLLFTGKAIKNIHIWSFEPPSQPNTEPVWQQLYDTQTNGNTIKLLQFRYSPTTRQLQGVSKSDGQKLRVWDLQKEETDPTDRPNRPPFQDVTNTESTLGVAGGFCLNGGAELYNQMSIVSLDVDDLQSPYNHTELALPGVVGDSSSLATGSRRRQQRGDLKSIVSVAGMELDAGQALLELSDGSILQYTTHPQSSGSAASGLPKLTVWKEPGLLPENVCRKLCVGRIGSVGLAVAAIATYDPSRGRGNIAVRALDSPLETLSKPARPGFWGFVGQPTLPNPVPVVETVPEIQALTETIHPVTTLKKAIRIAPQALVTAKKAPAPAKTPYVTPKPHGLDQTADRSTLPLVRRLATTTPVAPPRVSLNETFVLRETETSKAAISSKSVPHQQPSSKYLKTISGTKKAAKVVKPIDSLPRKSIAKNSQISRKDSASFKPTTEEGPRKRSPPIPRKRLAGGGKEMYVADALCALSASPAVPPRALQKVADNITASRFTKPPAAKSPRPTKASASTKPPVPVRSHARKGTDASKKRVLKECRAQVSKLRTMLTDIPKTTVASRVNLSLAATRNLEEVQVLERGKLAAQHCAVHEMLRKKVLRAALGIVQSLQLSPSVSALHEAKTCLEETVQSYRRLMVSVKQSQLIYWDVYRCHKIGGII